MDIQKIPLEMIRSAAYNPRKDLKPGDLDYEKLKKSMGEFDFIEPLVWNKRSGNLVGGHQRLKVLQEWGKTEVDCSVVDLDDTKEKALNLALNKISGEWDNPLLKDLLLELDTGAFDIEITGFDMDEIAALMNQLFVPEEGKTEDDHIPEATESICKKGDLWKLGNHRLFCGDATVITDVEKLMGGEKADMVFTDPPYGVDYHGGTINDKQRNGIKGDATDSKELYRDALSNAVITTKAKAAFYIWFASSHIVTTAMALRDAGLRHKALIIWHKTNAGFGSLNHHYKQKHEPCFYMSKQGEAELWCGPSNEVTVWDIARDGRNEYHLTQKPVALPERAIGNSSHLNDIVLDLFGGSGSTLIACEKLCRRCFMMEIDEHYCDVIIKRYEDFTGKQAERL